MVEPQTVQDKEQSNSPYLLAILPAILATQLGLNNPSSSLSCGDDKSSVGVCRGHPDSYTVAHGPWEPKQSEYGQFSDGSLTHLVPRSVKEILGVTPIFRLQSP